MGNDVKMKSKSTSWRLAWESYYTSRVRRYFLAPVSDAIYSFGYSRKNAEFSCRQEFSREWLGQENVVLCRGCKRTVFHDVCMSFWRFNVSTDDIIAKHFDVSVVEKNRSEQFLTSNWDTFALKSLKYCIFKLKCNYQKKSNMQEYENSTTRDNCSASLGKPRDAEQSPSWRNFQSAPHSH